ncbi:MAG: hypothetical protein ABEI13_00090 [Candidatus Paceibacteria bacterium]
MYSHAVHQAYTEIKNPAFHVNCATSTIRGVMAQQRAEDPTYVPHLYSHLTNKINRSPRSRNEKQELRSTLDQFI